MAMAAGGIPSPLQRLPPERLQQSRGKPAPFEKERTPPAGIVLPAAKLPSAAFDLLRGPSAKRRAFVRYEKENNRRISPECGCPA